ncbi:MAG: hypothetical protein AB2758_17740 [Candidatus Thiodiazotropha endolucinida]
MRGALNAGRSIHQRRKAEDCVGLGGLARTPRQIHLADINQYPVARLKENGMKDLWCLVAK